MADLGSRFAEEEGTHLFLSGSDTDSSKCSYLCLCPYEKIVIQSDHSIRETIEVGQEPPEVKTITKSPWEAMKELISLDRSNSVWPEWVGYFSYEMGQQLPTEYPLAVFYRSAVIVVADHQKGAASVIFPNPSVLPARGKSCSFAFWQSLTPSGYQPKKHVDLEEIEPFCCKQEYCKRVDQIQELIREGIVYQVNVSHRARYKGKIDPYSLFFHLFSENPAPFSCYAHTAWGQIISSSPERFLQLHNGVLETRPIKGTIARKKDPQQDQMAKKSLLQSAKDQAELLMITDLLRNDLAISSYAGSVKVKDLVRCEAYTNVFHLLSVIQSKKIADLHPVDVIQKAFPPGSVTGCPKVTACEAIATLEKRDRGVYTGCLGYFTGDGQFDFNVAIRTLTYKNTILEMSFGGGVVIDSDPEKEYEETLTKGESIFSVLFNGLL